MARPHLFAVPLLALAACAHRDRAPIEQPVGETHTTSLELRSARTEPERPIDGKIDVCVGGRDGATVHYETNGDRTRLFVTSADEKPKLDILLDRKSGIATLLMDDRKQYALLDLDTMGKHAAGNANGANVQFTGEKRQIGGRTCEIWRIAAENEAVQACVATGAPPFDLGAVESTVGFRAPGWLRAVVANGGIPMRVEILDGNGPTCVTEMNPKPPAEIGVPSDYTKIAP